MPTVAIAVLCVVPAVGVGPARNVGWALRSIQVILVLTYPLSAISKLQKSGWFWLNSAVFTRAIIRRGTEFGQFLMNHPTLLRIGQWSFFGFEVISVLALSRNASIRRFIVPGFFALHLFTYFAIEIHFLPHSICLVAFLPLETLQRLWRRGAAGEVRSNEVMANV
ncbi:MAG: hypothetical protein GX868_13375 [Actinobacteria bacterium]|nr:hypothetical protein [Actinomycetota bacterium]